MRMGYELRAVAYDLLAPSKPIVFERKANVVENLADVHPEMVAVRCSAEGKKRFFLGNSKHLQVAVRTNKSLFSSGDVVFLLLDVRNDSSKSVKGVCIDLYRCEHDAKSRKTREIKVKQCHRKFKGPDFKVSKGEAKQLVVDFQLPVDAETITSTQLFSVSYVMRVQFITKWSKNLSVEVPVKIVSSASYMTIFFATMEPVLVLDPVGVGAVAGTPTTIVQGAVQVQDEVYADASAPPAITSDSESDVSSVRVEEKRLSGSMVHRPEYGRSSWSAGSSTNTSEPYRAQPSMYPAAVAVAQPVS
jgi:hypothetical protein